VTEQQLANEILGRMKQLGWLAFHVRNSGMANISIVQGDKGFPDIIGIKAQRMIAAELKIGKAGTVKGDPRPEQLAWLKAFGMVGDYGEGHPIETYVWRPEDLPNIIGILRTG
jgi:hypothetical protein